MKCPHCERRFRPDAHKSYTALSTWSDQTVKAFTATDCPRCGGQILLGHRYPKTRWRLFGVQIGHRGGRVMAICKECGQQVVIGEVYHRECIEAKLEQLQREKK